MDEAPPTTPRTLLWRGTRCLRNDSPALRPCGLRRLCRLFGIDLAARQRETDLVLSIFAGLAPQHGLDRDLAPLAVLAHTLVELGDGMPDAGEILLTHPLKRLDAAGNRLLAMVLTLLTVGKGRTDKVEPPRRSPAAYRRGAGGHRAGGPFRPALRSAGDTPAR